MKTILFTLISIVLIFSLQAERIGKAYIKGSKGSINVTGSGEGQSFAAERNYFVKAVRDGRLALKNEIKLDNAVHSRYTQTYKGLEVFGGSVIFHKRDGAVTDISGEYYKNIPEISTLPLINADQALEICTDSVSDTKEYAEAREMKQQGFEVKNSEHKLVVYPVNGKFRLAYKMVVNKGHSYSMTLVVDAQNGSVLTQFSNTTQAEKSEILVGTGLHGNKNKLMGLHDDQANKYYLYSTSADFRPVGQITYDVSTYDGKYWYVGSASSDSITDAALADVHYYMGLTYDYYFAVHGRRGIDGNDMVIRANVHYPDQYGDNAFWSGTTKQMYFMDPGASGWHTSAALDVIAHEYTHGVTNHTSQLIYRSQSGALNESFSDIMATAVEYFYHQEGRGVLMADGYVGEDMKRSYLDKGIRNLVNPNDAGNSRPAHLSQYITLPETREGDWGGVHINATIFGHAYYLLAAGGVNPVSKITVDKIGIDKATKIYYNAFVNRLTPGSQFIDAANAIVASTVELYGNNGSEYASMKKSLEAIGYQFN